MKEKLLYKTRIPKRVYLFPCFLIPIALIFLYFGVSFVTTVYFLVLSGITLYILYVITNPITCVLSVYADRVMISNPFRLKKNLVFFYDNMRSKPVANLYQVKMPFPSKRYIIVYSFLYGENAKTLSLQLSPEIKDFETAHLMIIENLVPYLTSLNDTLTKGSKETGAHIVNLLQHKGMSKEQIIRLYQYNDLDEGIVERHFSELEEIKDHEFKEYKKDYSAGGYFLLAVGLLFILLSVISNGRFMIGAIFCIITGLSVIRRAAKIRR